MRIPLIIITNNFPFGIGENFFDSEFNLLNEKFETITIIAKNISDSQRLILPEKVKVIRYNTKSNFKEIYKTLFYILVHPNLFLKLFFNEILYVMRHFLNYPFLESCSTIFHDLIKAFQLFLFLKKNKLCTKAIYYSYWLNSTALSLSILKKHYPESFCISRGHRVDLYFYAQNKYIPYRKQLSQSLDQIFFISDNGKKYTEDLPEINNLNFNISRLGSDKLFKSKKWKLQKEFIIVSCSNIISVKRVDKIIDVLSQLNLKFKWTHFGSGEEIESLKKEASMKFETKDMYEFAGYQTNDFIQKYYSENNIDLFINLSSSEGIPVSIMEAFSYSVPVISNDVGGISEILNNNNGILVNANDEPNSIKDKIYEFLSKSEKEIQLIRDNSFKTWETHYNLSNNNLQFYNKIVSLWKSHKSN